MVGPASPHAGTRHLSVGGAVGGRIYFYYIEVIESAARSLAEMAR